jgi:hypothetical protein
MDLVDRYGDVGSHRDAVEAWFSAPAARPDQLDEFAATGVLEATDLKAQFDRSFFMGCEADDPLIPWAFAETINPYGARLHAMFGSDVSHWDVVDMTEPVEESYEHVEHGRMTEGDFRDFVFTNAVALHAGANPDFFAGTVVEAAVTEELA